MIERTETEAASFECPFSRRRGFIDSKCMGSKCMLWETTGRTTRAISVKAGELKPYLPPRDPFEYNPIVDNVKRAADALRAWVKENHLTLEVAKLDRSPGGDEFTVHVVDERKGHCGVMRS